MSCIAIIPARGGSKRIPKKNIKNFCGKPIIAYSIEAALSSGVFDEVMVSTDSEEIRQVAVKYGAKVPFIRSKETSNDMAMTHEVLIEVLNKYRENGMEYASVCCIYPTAPFIKAERLRECKKLLELDGVNGVIPVVAFSFPPQRCFLIKDNKLEYKWPENKLVRSQDLERWYHDSGQFYFVKTDVFLEEESLVVPNTVPLILDESEVQDIDNFEDWKIAEMKYHIMNDKLFQN